MSYHLIRRDESRPEPSLRIVVSCFENDPQCLSVGTQSETGVRTLAQSEETK